MRTARPLDGSGNILAYRRSLDGRRIVVALNFADAEGRSRPPAQVGSAYRRSSTARMDASMEASAAAPTRSSGQQPKVS